MKAANIAIFVPHAGCPQNCVFCNQRGISGARCVPSDGEIAATLHAAAENLGERTHTAQIAFFGGSFTAIPRGEMLRLLRAAQPFLGTDGFGGIRISTRPDAIDGEILDILKEYGVVAVELGAQSMDDGVLAASGRGHTAAHVAAASRLLRSRGFSLGLQMMTGLPMDNDKTAMRTAQTLADLKPDTMRIYPALVLTDTALAAMWQLGRYYPQTLDDAVTLCARLLIYFTERSIPVIRLGLHDSPTLLDDLLAGPYHPAFRELCESRVLLEKTLTLLEQIPTGEVCLGITPGSVSKLAGQRRRNLLELERRGYRPKIREQSGIPYLEVRLLS